MLLGEQSLSLTYFNAVIMSLKLMSLFPWNWLFSKGYSVSPALLPSFSLLNPGSKILRSGQSSSESRHSRGLPHFPVLQMKTLQCWTLSGKLSNCLMQYLQSLSCELAQFSRFIPPSALIPPQLHYTAQAFFQRALQLCLKCPSYSSVEISYSSNGI